MKKKYTAILAAIAAFIILSGIGAYAAGDQYKAGILNELGDDDVMAYAHSCLEGMFSVEESTGFSGKSYGFNDGMDALMNGDIDFLSMMAYDDNITQYVDFTSEPFAIGFLSLVARSDGDLYYGDYKKLDGAKIAMVQASTFEKLMLEFAAANGFNYVPVYCADVDELNKLLEDGSVDAIATSAVNLQDDMRLIGKCGNFGFYCAVKKGESRTLRQLDDMIGVIKDRTPFYLSEGYTKYFKIPYRNMNAKNEDDYNTAKTQGTLRVFVHDDEYPLEFYDIKDGRYEGAYIEILEQIAENAGLEIQYVSDDQNDRDATMDGIFMGKADAILTVSGSMSDVVKATEPYTVASFMPIGRKKASVNPDTACRVGVTRDYMWISEYISQKNSNWTIEEYGSINSMLSAVQRGSVDFALVSVPDMQTQTSLIAHPSLEIKDFQYDVPVCLGISIITCPQSVVTMLNKIIRGTSVPGAEFENRVYMLSHTYVPNFRDMIYANKLWVMVFIALVLIMLTVLYLRVRHFRTLARLDPLTHIFNRRYFIKAAEKIISKNPQSNYLLAELDASNFKLVNDRFGTQVGDQTLVRIAEEIHRRFKDKGLYARLQGDHFVILTADNAETSRLIKNLDNIDIHIHNSTNYRVPIKTGVCPIMGYDQNVPMTSYVDRANIAKADAEGASRNGVYYFTEKMADRLKSENEIEVDMAPALKRGDFIVMYQPKYDLRTDKIIGAEALVRWMHKDKGLISPGLFVPVLEKNGFITEVDFYVYEVVLKMLRRRLDNDKRVATVSLNVSRCHLTDPDFIGRLEKLVAKYRVPKQHIEMEITESIFSEGDNSANDLVYELKKRGFAVSMDDFGSGYSSLNLLRIMPIDTLKIDKVFIDDIEDSERSQSIVEKIIAMANKIKVKTICEGIETIKQRDILRDAGCDMGQGYFYSKPISESDFESLLDKS